MAKLEEEKMKIPIYDKTNQPFYQLNVSGVTEGLNLPKDLLCSFKDTPLEAMFSERHTINKDDNGHVCLDRDPDLFKQLINYLRSPQKSRIVVKDPNIKEGLKAEFKYWMIEPSAQIMTLQEYTEDINLKVHDLTTFGQKLSFLFDLGRESLLETPEEYRFSDYLEVVRSRNWPIC